MCKRVTHTHVYKYIFGCMYRASPPAGRTYTHGPAQESACSCAHARAHRRCRRAQRAAPHRSPAERVRRSACRRAESGAYRAQRGHTRNVPRADVRVERRRRPERLRAEPPAVPADGGRAHVSAQMCVRPIARAHTRARTDAARARVCAADTMYMYDTIYIYIDI
jgi:hypothetical protein